MRAVFPRSVRYGLTTLVGVGLVLAGCGVDPVADDGPRTEAPTRPSATATTTPSATAASQPDLAPSVTAEPRPDDTYVPPELALMPPDEDVERMVAEAEEAYLAHWEIYDAAAHTGFTDSELVDALLASAGEDTLESLHLQVAAIGDAGRIVEGTSDVVGIELYGLNPPQEDGPGLAVVLDACVQMQGVLTERDGTVVRELSGAEPRFIRARVVDHDGTWLLVSQREQDGPCPDGLVTDGAT